MFKKAKVDDMKNIGIVSCNQWKGIIKEDILIQEQLLENGISSEIISWEDDSVDYTKYDCLVLRSVWGYQNQYQEFKNWLLMIKNNKVKLYNSVDIILNNIRKDLQFGILDKYSIPHIPTRFIKKIDEIDLMKDLEGSIIIKPIISGSGQNTYMINVNSNDRKNSFDNILNSMLDIISMNDNGLMVQPFISGIKNGEYSCIFIDGKNTHNMLRFPGIFTSKQKPLYLESIPNIVKDIAFKVSDIPEYQDFLYMRVDIVQQGQMAYVMEVELAEPDLLIKYIPQLDIQQATIKTLTKRLERKI